MNPKNASKLGIYLTGAGAVTSVGFSLPATVAAMRSGVDCFHETNFYDYVGEPIIGSSIAPLDDDEENQVGGSERAGLFLALAIEEALIDAGVTTLKSAKLILVAPEKFRPTSLPKDLASFTQIAVNDRLSATGWDPADTRFQFGALQANGGSVGVCPALLDADKWLNDETGLDGDLANAVVVIASFDSWLNSQSIRHGLAEERFLVSDSSDGFVPGEAASAIVIQRRPRENDNRSLRIVGVGMAKEVASLISDNNCIGVGMSEAMKFALSQSKIEAHEIHHRLTNVSGEEYFFSESAHAWARVLRKELSPNYRYEIPASSIGEVGSAFGLLLLGYNHFLARSGKSHGPNTLIQLSSADEFRGVVISSFVKHS
ncbi:MAG: hypothetical protein AB8B55_08445 [Mariniblastus sp.]